MQLRKTNPVLAVVLVVCSFGLLLPLWLLALVFDQRPRRLDADGITTVRGKRYLWRELEEATPHAEYRRLPGGAQRLVTWSLRLRFKTGKLTIVPSALVNGRAVITRIEAILGRSFSMPDSASAT